MASPSSTAGITPHAPYICCQQLLHQLGAAKVNFPSSSNYTTIKDSYWSIQEASLSPTCIVVPRSSKDVASTVQLLAANPNCHFAIKGNTHAPAAGFANIENGITIDMTGLNSLSLSEDHSVASIGSGVDWLAVYAFLDPHNLTVAGGRNGLVGAGGLLLGGGISHYTPRVGLACDNVINFELVTADGNIVNANRESHPTLYRALKGGGNNFGLITRFDLATFTQGELSISTATNDVKHTSDVAKAFSDITDAPIFDPYTSLVTSFTFNVASKAWSIGNSAVYTKTIAKPKVFEKLLAIPSIKNSSSFEQPHVYANETNTPPLNWLFWTGTYGVSAELMTKMIDIANESIYNFDTGNGLSVWSLTFEPLPTAITQKTIKNGGDVLGLENLKSNSFVILWGPLWEDSSRSEDITRLARQIGEKFNAAAKSMGLLRGYQYLNYADTSQNPIASYGPENAAFLKTVSRQYDPEGLFQRQVPGGFKLSKAEGSTWNPKLL